MADSGQTDRQTDRQTAACVVVVDNERRQCGSVKAKFHYMGPTGPARTLSETRTDPTEFLGDPVRKKVRAGPCGSV